jgi:hypothetical protein
MLTERTLGKLLAGAFAAYLLYIAITCPCKQLYSCHLSQLYLTLVGFVAVLIYFNGLRVMSY